MCMAIRTVHFIEPVRKLMPVMCDVVLIVANSDRCAPV